MLPVSPTVLEKIATSLGEYQKKSVLLIFKGMLHLKKYIANYFSANVYSQVGIS